jgi:hypothetical protein
VLNAALKKAGKTAGNYLSGERYRLKRFQHHLIDNGNPAIANVHNFLKDALFAAVKDWSANLCNS